MKSDKLTWFKFFPSNWAMGKIKKVPEITQARFINLCCLYWNKKCNLSIEDAEIEIDKEHLDILISKKIVKTLGFNICIDFLDEQNEAIIGKSEDLSEKGFLGNLKRWHIDIYNKVVSKEITMEEAKKTIANLSPPDSEPIANLSQNIADKIRIDKIRIYNIDSNESLENEFSNNEKTKFEELRKLNLEEIYKQYKQNTKDINLNFCLWNHFAKKNNKPEVIKITKDRKKKLGLRLKNEDFILSKVLELVKEQKFAMDNSWFTLDWLIKNDENYIKVYEKKYILDNDKDTGDKKGNFII